MDVHFIHVRSRHPGALPLIMTPGWPGSVIEMLDSVGPLTDPTAHGGTATDSFHLVLPSHPSGNLTRDHVLDNITAYWLTGTGTSAARSYWEAYGPDAPSAGSEPLAAPRVPVGFSTFPGEIWRTPRSWAEASYPTLSYFGEAERGGHFAAWEEPELFAAELRAAFLPLQEPEGGKAGR